MKKTCQRAMLLRHGSVEQATLNMFGINADSGGMFLMMMQMMQGGS